jgi:streptogramin lyase
MFLTALQFMPLIASSTDVPTGNTASLTEWSMPTSASGAWSLALDQQGRCCWFVEYFGNKVGHLDPNTGVVQEWTLPTTNANPYDVAVTTVSGSPLLWGTEFGSNKIFAFSPNSGVFHEYTLPHGGSGAGYISIEPTTSSQVRIWFTEILGNRNGEFIYDPATSNVTLYEDSFPSAVGGGAFGVYAGTNSVWFAGFSALVRWDRSSQQYTTWPLPVHGSALGRFVTLDSSGDVWFTQGSSNATSLNNFAGVLRGNMMIQEWQVPSLGADLRGIAIDASGRRPWVVEESPSVGNGAVAVLDNSTGSTVVAPTVSVAPSGGSPVALSAQPETVAASARAVTPTTTQISSSLTGPFSEYALGPTQPHDVVVDANGNVWLSEPGSNKIARISGFGPDFGVYASPSFIAVVQGGSADITITGTSISGYAGPASVAATGIPSGVSLSPSNPPVLNIPSGGNASLSAVLHVAQGAAIGTSVILFQVNNGTLDHSASVILVVTSSTSSPSSSPQCLIATATFGSALSPEVELLRNFRDNDVARTKMGASFMIAFNAWYYSFSPSVANYIAGHETARAVMKLYLYPLITFLSIASALFAALSAYPDLAVYVSGVFASSLIGAFYVGLPLGLLNRRLRLIGKRTVRLQIALVAVGSIAIVPGVLTSSMPILTISSTLTVLSVICASAMFTASALSVPRIHSYEQGRVPGRSASLSSSERGTQ